MTHDPTVYGVAGAIRFRSRPFTAPILC